MVAEKTLTKLGFTKDEDCTCFDKMFKNNTVLNELHIDIYNENPVNHSSLMLLLRTFDKNVLVKNDNNRLILEKGDKFNTYIINIMVSEVKTIYKKMSNNYVDFLLNVCDVWYKITIFI